MERRCRTQSFGSVLEERTRNRNWDSSACTLFQVNVTLVPRDGRRPVERGTNTTRTKRRFGRDARPIIIITGIHGAQLGRAKDRRRTVACIALLSSFIPLDFHLCVPCIDYKYHDRVITHMCNYTGSSRYYIIFGFVTFRFNRLESRLHAFLRRTIALSLSVSAGFQLAPWNLSIAYAFPRILSRLFYLNYRAD